MGKYRVYKIDPRIIARPWVVFDRNLNQAICLHSKWKDAFRCAELRAKRGK